jgi:KDO2-lipid IV(A) lauroyltransferase
MARKGKLNHLAEYAALRLALGFFGVLGVDRASAVGGWLGRTIGPRVGITNRARRNIALAMPELGKDEIERIVTAMWDNLGRTVGEYAHLPLFAKPEERHRLEVVHAEMLRALASSGNGGVFVSGHFANWEILPVVMQFEGLEGGEVYRHANNPYVNAWLIRLREKVTRAVQIPKGGPGARVIVRLMKENRFVAMLTDQKMNDGIETTFFGLRAMSTAAPAGLAVRYNDPIVPAWIERLDGANFRITVYNPITARPGADPAADVLRITQELNDFLEARIRERPDQWLWLHDRWSEPAWPRKRKTLAAEAD